MKGLSFIVVWIVAMLACTDPSGATNGYFSHGYGMKSKGMGGATSALPQDAFGGANNPASMVWVGDRLDIGAELFIPKRRASRTGSAGGIFDGSAESDRDYFGIPEFGYNKLLNADMSIGITAYGNGGLNTEYPPSGQTDRGACSGGLPSGVKANNLLCGTTRLGVDLMQVVIAPTLSYRVTSDLSIGVSPLIGYQRFRAEGLQVFANAVSSRHPGEVTDRGYDSALGAGARIGLLAKLSPIFSFAATYSSKIAMSRFDKYRGLFAEQGKFDVPETYTLGIALRLHPTFVAAFDYQRINYADVRAVGNPSNAAAQFGSDNGPGFGWSNINVFKIGMAYALTEQWTVRAGYNHGDNPIQGRDVTVNILAPGVITDHLTLGATYTFAPGREVTVMYMHAFENTLTGASTLGAGGLETIRMTQNSVGIALGWKL